MNPLRRLTFLSVLFYFILLQAQPLSAQIYPIKANLNLVPPYSPYLSDYIGTQGDNLQLFLLAEDQTLNNYPIKFKITIEGLTSNTKIITSDAFNPAPVFISGGAPLLLNGMDVAGYLKPQNLYFASGDAGQFALSTKLPDGFYRISFQAFDYYRNVAVSNPATFTGWLMLNQPPFLSFPINNSRVDYLTPQNLLFQWSVLNISPNSSGVNAEFEFTLVELSPNTRTPNDAIVNTKPILQERTSQPFLLYDLNYPTLQPGKTYIWRVRAVDVSGRDLFVNSGYSETWLFVYGNSCTAPGNVAAEALSTSSARISYRLDPWQTGFNLRYRVKTTANNAAWESKSNTGGVNKFTLDKLKDNTEYEYQLQGNCNNQLSDWTDTKIFKTFAKETKGFVCGAVPPGVDLKNINLIPELKTGDILLAADMEYILTSVKKNGDGTFSGTASAEYAVFNNLAFSHKFENIKVNTDRRMFQGVIYAESAEIEILDEATRNDIIKSLGGDNAIAVLRVLEEALRDPEELERKFGEWVKVYDGEDKDAVKADYASMQPEMAAAIKALKEAKASGNRAAKTAAKNKIRELLKERYAPLLKKMISGTLKKLFNDFGQFMRSITTGLNGVNIGKLNLKLNLKLDIDIQWKDLMLSLNINFKQMFSGWNLNLNLPASDLQKLDRVDPDLIQISDGLSSPDIEQTIAQTPEAIEYKELAIKTRDNKRKMLVALACVYLGYKILEDPSLFGSMVDKAKDSAESFFNNNIEKLLSSGNLDGLKTFASDFVKDIINQQIAELYEISLDEIKKYAED